MADCQLQRDVRLVWKGSFVQSTDNITSEKDKNIGNIGRPRAPIPDGQAR
jgi:hypothetical protein